MDKQEVIKAAQTLKAYCRSCGEECNGCMFLNNDEPYAQCGLILEAPVHWNIPKTLQEVVLEKLPEAKFDEEGVLNTCVNNLFCDLVSSEECAGRKCVACWAQTAPAKYQDKED